MDNSKNIQYRNLNDLLNHNDADFCKRLTEKVKKISTFINKIPLLDDQAYYMNKSEEYKKVLKQTQHKITNIIGKMFTFTHPENSQTDINK
jgi:hypothetical protein